MSVRSRGRGKSGTGRPSRPAAALWINVIAAISLVLSLLGILTVLATVYQWLADKDILIPDFALPMLLLAGAVLFFGAIAVLVSVYRSLGLDDPGHALGLPEGSVRAIIALILVFLFFVAITFIYFSALGGPPRDLKGLTPAQFAQIPVRDVISSTPSPSTGTPTSYDVVVRISPSGAAEDIGKNLVVLLGTLVTAVVAFYFGTNSATSAAAAAREQQPAAPVVTSISPNTGPAAGGDRVTIIGSGFTADARVRFGSNAAPSTRDSETQITAVSPAGSAGVVDVTVETDAGASTTSNATKFTYR